MLSLDSYRAAVRLDAPTEITSDPDWQARLPGLLNRLGVTTPAGATESQSLDALHGLLAMADPNTLDAQLVHDVEAVAAGMNRSRAATIPPQSVELPRTAYPVSDNIELMVGDITTLDVDAVVNAANTAMLGCRIPNHRCIDNAIHSAAGPRLRDDCALIMARQNQLEAVGEAKITRGYALPARFVVHTVGPQLARGADPTPVECDQLASAYRACLDVASQVESISTIAFCGISTGVFSFPRERAAQVALTAIAEWALNDPERFSRIIIDCYTDEDAAFYLKVLRDWN